MAVVETERLLLRPLSTEDLDDHHAVVGSDPDVTWSGTARTLEESRTYLEEHRLHWAEHGFGMWAVIEKGSGRLLGHAGLQYLEETGDVQVGYYLGKLAWGSGFATEAGRAALRYGFEVLGLPHIVAVVRPENRASQHVLSKLGLHRSRVAPHYGFVVEVWRIDAQQYRPEAIPFKVLHDDASERAGSKP
ncbi:MAG TPA: GNAT family N-acetyltransferase [Thermomicrobiales bacterium]|nr:GNAT family N-acetyltransferase [Thermomicrobiales bacterium]